MRIAGAHLQQVAGTYLKQVRKQEPVSSLGAAQVDQVSVSERAGEILQARQAYNALPEARTEQVSEIREKIQGGTYTLDDAKISQAMLLGTIRDRLLRKDEG